MPEIPRRRFLRTGSALSAAALGAALPRVAAAPRSSGLGFDSDARGGPRAVEHRRRSPKFLLSLAAYSFRRELSAGEMSLEDFVDYCAEHDLEGTELTSYYFKDTSPGFLTRLRHRAYVNGLTISGTPVGNNFCHPVGPERAKQVAHVEKWIDHVVTLGSQTIRVFAGNAPKGVETETARAWAVECLKEVSAYAGERGVILALENHGGITARADELIAIVEAVDSPWLGVNLDGGNFRTDPYGDLEKAAPYAVSVQVKVEVRSPDGKSVPADLARVAGILRRANYRGFVALEYEAREPVRDAVPRYLRALRDALS